MVKKNIKNILILSFIFIFIIIITSNKNIHTIKTDYLNYMIGNHWWIYDHTDNESSQVFSDETHRYSKYTLNKQQYESHIDISDDGKVITFNGYRTEPIADFVYYPSDSKNTKTYQFKISPSRIDNMHTFLGAGILFNTDISGNYSDNNQVLDGYLLFISRDEIQIYELNGIYTSTMQNGLTILDGNLSRPKLSYKLHATMSKQDRLFKSDSLIRVETTPTTVKVWLKEYYEDGYELTDADIIQWNTGDTTLTLPEKPSYGFGLLMQFASHACFAKTQFVMTDVELPVKLSKGEITPESPEDVIEKPETPQEEKEEAPKEVKDCTDADYAKKHTSECYTCDNEEYKKTHEDICTKVSCNGSEMRLKDAKRLSKIIDAIKKLIDMSKIIVPIILILMGSIDMIKAMLANNEESKKIYMLFVRRCIYAICIFLLGTIINLIFDNDCEKIIPRDVIAYYSNY